MEALAAAAGALLRGTGAGEDSKETSEPASISTSPCTQARTMAAHTRVDRGGASASSRGECRRAHALLPIPPALCARQRVMRRGRGARMRSQWSACDWCGAMCLRYGAPPYLTSKCRCPQRPPTWDPWACILHWSTTGLLPALAGLRVPLSPRTPLELRRPPVWAPPLAPSPSASSSHRRPSHAPSSLLRAAPPRHRSPGQRTAASFWEVVRRERMLRRAP